MRKKILLVDDVKLFLEMEKDFFRRENFTILEAGSGREAAEKIVQHRPDLVFMDLYMPGGNGDEACRTVRENPDVRFTPIVIVTNSKDPNDLERCRKAGCDAFLTKPINREHFLATAFRILGASSADSTRVNIRLPVHYGSDSHMKDIGHSVDLSCGGIFITSETPHPAGTSLSLEFTLPGQLAPVHSQGRVAWVNPSDWRKKKDLPTGMAVKFLHLNNEAGDHIREYIKKWHSQRTEKAPGHHSPPPPLS
ncbi:MAG: two-component system response regulator [Desulfuromonas sp.]|uniref:TIGR02266 family protein n=1 Tax=Desulfuromonas sp. TaxID=892 RepID=UPI000CB34174|nr:TIGR02266 family protein [Desulfuromonas sp.]PLX83351.1 MAG: two-component system response regulator [Desulfuromonas sp.]